VIAGFCGLAFACSGPEPNSGEEPGTGGAPNQTEGSDASGGSFTGTGGGVAFALTSPAFANVDGCSVESSKLCGIFPDENVSYMDHANISPELHWTNAPQGTQSFALILMDVTFGQAHWAFWNIPGEVTMIAADVPQDTATPASLPGSRQSNANFATTSEEGYFGPHIPCNVFEFQLYALPTNTFSPMDPESAVLVAIELQELGAAALGVARLTGRSGDYAMACE